jgi:exopolysaccharide biosynthesis protein
MYRFFFFFGAVFFLSGCGSVSVSFSGPEGTHAVIGNQLERRLPAYVSRRVWTDPDSGASATFLVARLDPAAWRWDLAQDVERPKTPREWRDALEAQLVINGSYFTASGTPSGFYQNFPTTEKSLVPWPNAAARTNTVGYTGAVRIVDGKIVLSYLPKEEIALKTTEQLFLTYPTLLYANTPLVEKDSGFTARRTVLATDAAGVTYAIVTEAGLISLYDLAVWLREQPEAFAIAVNLDGGPSTGLALKDGDAAIDTSLAAVPNVVVGRKK